MHWPGREKVLGGGGRGRVSRQRKQQSQARRQKELGELSLSTASQEGREEEEGASTCPAPLFGRVSPQPCCQHSQRLLAWVAGARARSCGHFVSGELATPCSWVRRREVAEDVHNTLFIYVEP